MKNKMVNRKSWLANRHASKNLCATEAAKNGQCDMRHLPYVSDTNHWYITNEKFTMSVKSMKRGMG